jgi:hypothetical protein
VSTGNAERCGRCGRPLGDWPLERGDRCSPADWKTCIRLRHWASLALTVRQHWAWAIMHAGKDVENRVRGIRHRGTLLIHAGRQLDADAPVRWPHGAPRPPKDVPLGKIVGAVRVVDVVRDSTSVWAQDGAVHWVLADPIALAEPVPCRGFQWPFRPPAHVVTQVREQLPARYIEEDSCSPR